MGKINIVYTRKPLEEIKKNHDFNHEGYFDILENFYWNLPTQLWSGKIGVHLKNVQGTHKYTAFIEDFDKVGVFFEASDATLEEAIKRVFTFFNAFYEPKEEAI